MGFRGERVQGNRQWVNPTAPLSHTIWDRRQPHLLDLNSCTTDCPSWSTQNQAVRLNVCLADSNECSSGIPRILWNIPSRDRGFVLYCIVLYDACLQCGISLRMTQASSHDAWLHRGLSLHTTQASNDACLHCGIPLHMTEASYDACLHCGISLHVTEASYDACLHCGIPLHVTEASYDASLHCGISWPLHDTGYSWCMPTLWNTPPRDRG